MILYLHGFDSTSPGNHEKIMQLQFIDPDVRFINYSTLHPKHDMQHLLKEVSKQLTLSDDKNPLICGVGLGGFWAERVGFLNNIKQVIFNPNLFPQENMVGLIDRPEEYEDIASKCVNKFREKNRGRCLVILSRHNEKLDNVRSYELLSPFYPVIWDEVQTHKFKSITAHLKAMKEFKQVTHTVS
ncbi:MAG: alpha/beta hydrolase YcfP [Vibrionaceae bacterium]